jgi:hypothetical protein
MTDKLRQSNILEELSIELDSISLQLDKVGQKRVAGLIMQAADALSSEAAWLSEAAINEIKEQSRGERI